jgi:hypothetical protein
MVYDPKGLHLALVAAGLEIEGCSSEGRIDWKSPPTMQQLAQAEAIKSAHDSLAREQRRIAQTARFNILRDKRRAGNVLTAAEIAEVLDLLMDV